MPPQPPANSQPESLRFLGQDKRFSTLNSLIGTAGLGSALTDLENKGAITIFAPTEEAFNKLDPAVKAKLLKPENKDALTKILQYHVSEGTVDFSKPGQTINSLTEKDGIRLFGNAWYPQIDNGTQGTVNGQTALQTTDKTVIIPIDQVLLPPDFDPATLK